MTFIAHISRKDLVGCLPAGGVAAEIGVANGDFSADILETAQPGKLHLVDPWIFQDRSDYVIDPTNVADDVQKARYRNVCNRFSPEVAAGKVTIHRGFSDNVLPEFPDNHFDWIYVDAMHTKEAVLNDLRLCLPKLKEDGFLLGHDYADNYIAQKQGFGVIQAVNEFVAESDFLFLALNMEMFPSYVLARRNGEVAARFIVTLLKRATSVVELRGAPDSYRQKVYVMHDDKSVVTIPTF